MAASSARVGDERAHVREAARDGGRRGHGGRHEVRAPAGPLAALEVAVRRRRAALLGPQLVGVHREAHGAAGLAPLEARRFQNLVEALGLGLLLDEARAGHDHGVDDVRRDGAAGGDGGDGAHVLDAAVRAGADEDAVDGHVREPRARLEAHVRERAPHRRRALLRRRVRRVRHDAVDRRRVLRRRAPRDRGRDVGRVDDDRLVVRGAGVARERLPVGDGAGPLGARGAHGPALEVGVRRRVGRDEARARAGLDGHVRDGHAPLHREAADGLAGELDGAARAAGRADAAADVEHDVLRRHARAQRAVDAHEHVLRLLLGQRLRREHVLDLARADAERERAERAVRRRVRVAADAGRAGQREALLGPNDVHDALALVGHAKVLDAEVLDVPLERLHLGPRRDVGQEGLDGLAARVEGVAVRRRHVVVHRRERAVGPPHGPAGEAQALEGLRRRHLVDQVAVDVDERRAGLVLGHDEVVVPDLVEERPRRAARGRAQRRAAAGPRRAPRRREAIGTHHHCYGDDRAHGLREVAAASLDVPRGAARRSSIFERMSCVMSVTSRHLGFTRPASSREGRTARMSQGAVLRKPVLTQNRTGRPVAVRRGPIVPSNNVIRTRPLSTGDGAGPCGARRHIGRHARFVLRAPIRTPMFEMILPATPAKNGAAPGSLGSGRTTVNLLMLRAESAGGARVSHEH